MPGSNSILTQHYPDDFQTIVVTYTGTNPSDPTPILYADRNLVIDQIVVGVGAAGGSGYVLDFRVGSSPVDTTGGSMAYFGLSSGDHNMQPGFTGVATTDSITWYNSSGAITTLPTGSVKINGTTDGPQNVLASGKWLILDTSGTACSAKVVIQVRYRSRLN